MLGIALGVTRLVGLGTPVRMMIRSAAMLGYLSVFLACLSSAFLRRLTRTFGRPFVQVHHVVSVAGLVLLLVHALTVAWNAGSLAVFIPPFDSVTRFLEFGGRPAIWLIGVAALAAVLRSSLRRSWRSLHWLNYLAFLLGTIHGVLIGTDFQPLAVKVVSIAMALTVVGVFVHRRAVTLRRRSARR
jgi:predicted ferric reductase